MKNLIKHVQSVNFRECLWQRGDALVLGVSGGADSMCLLDVLVNIAQKEDLTLIVAHVNYGLRGEDSDADEELVRTVCAAHRLPCQVKRIREHKESGSEALWRKQRYAYFDEVRERHGAEKVLLGHNANDQAETILLHLLRGSGLNGLRGMQCQRDHIARPLLRVQRKEILSYCDEKNISYHTDTTNQDTAFVRNRIRDRLLPLLAEEYNSEIMTTLQRTADHIADDYDFLSEAAEECIPAEVQTGAVVFSVGAYQNCHRSLQYLRLHQLVMMLQGDHINIISGNIDELHKALVSTKNKTHVVRMKGLKMERKGDTVKLTTEA